MVNAKELKALLKKHKKHFYSYWDKKRLLDLANEHKLLLKKASENEKSRNLKYDRLIKALKALKAWASKELVID